MGEAYRTVRVNFLTKYLRLKSIFLSPDSNFMTHTTWQTSVQVSEYGKKGKNHLFEISKKNQSLIFSYKTNAGQFAMSLGAKDLNLGSKRLILVGYIRSVNLHPLFLFWKPGLVYDPKEIGHPAFWKKQGARFFFQGHKLILVFKTRIVGADWLGECMHTENLNNRM